MAGAFDLGRRLIIDCRFRGNSWDMKFTSGFMRSARTKGSPEAANYFKDGKS